VIKTLFICDKKGLKVNVKRIQWRLEQRRVSELVPYSKNPRIIDGNGLKDLENSFDEIGMAQPININTDNTILSGHARTQQLKKEGVEIVDVYVPDRKLTPKQEEAVIIRMNKNVAGTWDFEKLTNDFDFEDLENWGFTKDELSKPEVEVIEGKGDENHIPEAPAIAKTKLGDVWLLGKHRLICGDSTNLNTYEKLMRDAKADITFTSPPYNAGKTPKENGKYVNNTDDLSDEDYAQFLSDFTTNCLMFSDYVFSNIQSISGNKVALINHLYDMQSVYADTIIWNKESAQPAMARRVLNSQFEYIHIFSNEATRAIGKRDFRGTIPNLFTLGSRAGKEFAKVHKATFRVELPEMFLENFTELSCLDPFCGTGTTIIACEKNNRQCFGIELDPIYCDIIIKRWEKFTGKKAELESGDI